MSALPKPQPQPEPRRRIRVLIVDDSAVVREAISRSLASAPDIEVVGTAADPYIARDKIISLNPDVLTLDVEMPRMDGITFLTKLMAARPTPVIVISSLTTHGAATTLKALEAGAVEVLHKPAPDAPAELLARELAEKIRTAARAKARPADPPLRAVEPPPPAATTLTWSRIVAIGASTGGVQALTAVLTQFPDSCPPTLVVQHMPPKFTATFAQRLNDLCRCEVREAHEGDRVADGLVLLAPGGRHMALRRDGIGLTVALKDGPPVFHQKPAVEVLFDSATRVAGNHAVGAILTGMGTDGAAALLRMRQAGARTFAEDASTAIVYGMPAEAARLGAAEKILPLHDIPRALLAAAK
jgi:two-component system, chemotaxis family, protein-glutamate methylesterase/glutaminase